MIKTGYATYGHAIGIIMMDCQFTRIPDDMGNATTFDFPVLYKIVRGVPVEKIVNEGDERYLPQFIDAARELEACGVRAITTSCGCLALFQNPLSAAVRVPLFASTLLQVPLVHQLLGGNGKVGILAADSRILSDEHFQAAGWSREHTDRNGVAPQMRAVSQVNATRLRDRLQNYRGRSCQRREGIDCEQAVLASWTR